MPKLAVFPKAWMQGLCVDQRAACVTLTDGVLMTVQ